MVCAAILLIWILVQNAGPHGSAASLRCDREVQQGKLGTSSFFHIIQVHVKGENPNSGNPFSLIGDVVGMRLEVRNRQTSKEFVVDKT
jgi:hypothetical protein